MGGQINTNDTHGSSNFEWFCTATVDANSTAGFSVVMDGQEQVLMLRLATD